MLALSKHGYTVFRSNAGRVQTKDGRFIRLFPPGAPDLIGFVHKTGQIFFIEVKNKKGRLRNDQKLFAKFIGQYPKAIYGVARSSQDALDILKEGTNSDERNLEGH